MTCAKCGAHIPDGSPRCLSCLAPVARDGLLQRLFRALAPRAPAPPRIPARTFTTEIRTERINVRDAQGQVRTYNSIDEVPADIREKIEQARLDAERGGGGTKITVTDASGATRTYASVAEMPADVREMYERVQRQKTR